MRGITGAQLLAQYKAARSLWGSVIDAAEKKYSLPRFLLYAVGSRETNLNVKYTQGSTGDGGHGHGLFQLDDRWHTIPSGFDRNIAQQASIAAKMLSDLIGRHGLHGALNAYNSGQTSDAGTTGHNYGPDVLERLAYLVSHESPDPKPDSGGTVYGPAYPGRVLSQPPIMNGTDVEQWQAMMAKRGWTITVDGSYGPNSESVCRKFQSEKHLAVDGMVGPQTWETARTVPVS